MIRGKFLTSMDDTSLCLSLREQVFGKDMGLTEAAQPDGYDIMAVYALALDEQDEPSGSARLYIDDDNQFTIDSVCVLREKRGQGLADLMMRMLLYRALELNCAGVKLATPIEHWRFFARYGLKRQGDRFEQEGMQYQTMYAPREEIDIEGSCSKGGACNGCKGDCAGCANKEKKADYRPLIGITATCRDGDETQPYVHESYCEALEKAGAICRMVGFHETEQSLSDLDGILFSGGVDWEPAEYGEEIEPECGKIQKSRDLSERKLVAWAVEKGIPVLGICRGIQTLNVCLGGTLHQHVPNLTEEVHRDSSHMVNLKEGSWYHQLAGKTCVEVNSLHHQAVKDLAPSLEICAYSETGIIEAVDRPQSRFFKGVQWHPERLPEDPFAQKIFQAFVQAAKE